MAKKPDQSQDNAAGGGQEDPETTELNDNNGDQTDPLNDNQNSENKEGNQGGEIPPSGDTPPAEKPDQSQDNAAGGESIRVQNDGLKNVKLTLGNGKIAEFNAEGIAEIEAPQADRLLKIPGYKKI